MAKVKRVSEPRYSLELDQKELDQLVALFNLVRTPNQLWNTLEEYKVHNYRINNAKGEKVFTWVAEITDTVVEG